jgi:hypothetical protein
VLNGFLYTAGGIGRSGSTVERYDTTASTWTAVADMLERQHGFDAVTIGSTGPAEEQNLFDSLIAKAFH